MSALKEFFTHLRQRKLTRTLLAYGAVGWAILEGIERYGGFLPDIVESVAPILFIAGIPYCLILGWFHGEKGRQRVGLAEASLLGLATIATIGLFWLVPASEGSRGSGGGADLYRIGVLPFSAIGGREEDLAGFADGLSRELSRTLSQVEALEVAPDRAVSPYRQGEASLDSISRALGVSLLVDGTVARVGDSVVVTPTLYEASAEGATLWGERFAEPVEGEWDWSLIERVTHDLAATLRAELGDQIRLRRWRAGTESHEAWQLLQSAYRQSDVAWNAFMEGRAPYASEMLGRADSLLARAAELDDEWAEPHLLRGQLTERRALLGRFFPAAVPSGGQDALLEEGLEHVDRALSRDPDNPLAWELRGTLGLARLSFARPSSFEEFLRIEEQAVRDLQRAVQIDPFMAPAWSKLASVHLSRGDFDDARDAAEVASRQDAFLERPVETQAALIEATFELGEEAHALELARQGAPRFEGIVLPELELQILAWGSHISPDVDRAREIAAGIMRRPEAALQPGLGAMLDMTLAGVLARAGRADSARAVMERARDAAPDDPRVLRRQVGVLARLGEEDDAVQLLETILDEYPTPLERLLTRRMFEPLRDHPRIAARLEPGG